MAVKCLCEPQCLLLVPNMDINTVICEEVHFGFYTFLLLSCTVLHTLTVHCQYQCQ